MSMWRRLLAVVTTALVLALAAPSVQGAECCDTCIGKTASSVYDYDPLVIGQCKLKPDGADRICCFECGTFSEPQYSDTISYASDGTTPTIKVGKWVSFLWTNVTKVTYTALKENQKKTVTPTLNDPAATITSGYYMICAKAKGSIIMRGWGDDTCRQASTERDITVLEGEAGATCETSAPKAPTTTPAPTTKTPTTKKPTQAPVESTSELSSGSSEVAPTPTTAAQTTESSEQDDSSSTGSSMKETAEVTAKNSTAKPTTKTASGAAGVVLSASIAIVAISSILI